MSSNASMPYVVAARDYLEAGWSPIPLPFKRKDPPPDDFTGNDGAFVDMARVRAWTRALNPERCHAGNLVYPPGNIGLRIPDGVLGIDGDFYNGKKGAETIRAKESDWGTLPDTWMSSARKDGSGIRFYRTPTGLRWPGILGPGVELIRWYHRYAVVAPSIHPDLGGVRYKWYRPDGSYAGGEIPSIDDLTDLPAEWVTGMTRGQEYVPGTDGGDIDDDEARAWLDGMDGTGELCEGMLKTLAHYEREVRTAGDDGGAHERARDGAWALIGDAAFGHSGVKAALKKLRTVFITSVRPRRKENVAAGEWRRIVVRGVGKVRAEQQAGAGGGAAERGIDPCSLFASEMGQTPSPRSKSKDGVGGGGGEADSGHSGGGGSSAFDYVRDDIGNAERLLRRVGSDGRYVASYGSWAVYDPQSSLWDLAHGNSAMTRAAIAMVRAMETEAQYIEDPKAQAAFMGWVRRSGSSGSIASMMSLATNMKGVHLEAEKLDADPDVLHVANGVLDLSSMKLRGRRHGDYATFACPVPYVIGAESVEWDRFLEVVLPDADDRLWVQTIAGYSILGANPERVMVFAKGPTSSGKTTFLETVRAALGGYCASFNLSLFRDKQDEGPRNDIVEALPKRLLIASEASAQWFLHADAIKRFTGGDPIRARRLSSNIWVERVPAFTPWLGTNSYPQVPGADKALYTRLKAAPFMISLPEEKRDSALRRRLLAPEVLTAVLSWLVAGWERYRAEGLALDSHNALEMLFEAKNSMSDVDVFLSEACEFGPSSEVWEEARRLYDVYRAWCETGGVQPNQILSANAFGRALTGKGYDNAQKWADNANHKVRLGLKLKKEWEKFG